MSVQAVGTSVAVAQPQRQAGGKGRAWASAFIPGLGQFLDGRKGAGAGYMAANSAVNIGFLTLAGSLDKDTFKYIKVAAGGKTAGDVVESIRSLSKINVNNVKIGKVAGNIAEFLHFLPKGKVCGLMALGSASMILAIANIVDAYKGGKEKA